MDAPAPLPPNVYADEAPLTDLRTVELLVVVSTRLYVLPRGPAGHRADWRGGLRAAGLGEGEIRAFDAFLTIVGHGQSRPLDFRCPCRRVLGRDEGRLLQLISLVQHDRRECAEAILADWLTPTARRLAAFQVAALATGLKRNGLTLPWRRAAAATAHRTPWAHTGSALLH